MECPACDRCNLLRGTRQATSQFLRFTQKTIDVPVPCWLTNGPVLFFFFLSVEEIINGLGQCVLKGNEKWAIQILLNQETLMKLSISVYCILLYYQKVFNYNVQNLLNALLDCICRTPNCFSGWGGVARLDNWRYNQHNVFWKGKEKLRHMFTYALILCKMGCFSFNTAQMSFHLQFRVCFIYLTGAQMLARMVPSTDPTWRIATGSWVESRSKQPGPSLERL